MLSIISNETISKEKKQSIFNENKSDERAKTKLYSRPNSMTINLELHPNKAFMIN